MLSLWYLVEKLNIYLSSQIMLLVVKYTGKTFYRRSGRTGPLLDLFGTLYIMHFTMLDDMVFILYFNIKKVNYESVHLIINIQKMTYLDARGRPEKTCISRPEDVKDVGSTFISELFFNHNGT